MSIILRTDVPYDIFEHDEGVELVPWRSMMERGHALTMPPATVTLLRTGQKYLGSLAPSMFSSPANRPVFMWNYIGEAK